MPDPTPTRPARPMTPSNTDRVTPVSPVSPASAAGNDKMLCDRCGADMYRMHAVWRCSACGFKTDCCGW